MAIEKPTNQKNMNKTLPSRGMEDVRLHHAFPLLINNFSRRPVMLHKHSIIAVGTESLSAFVTARIDDEKEAPRMDDSEKTKQR